MKKWLFKILKIIFFLAVLFFLCKLVYDNINGLKNMKFEINVGLFSLSLLAYIIYKFYNAVLWHYITTKSGCSISVGNSIISWSYSQLGKFIPGKVFYLVARLYRYKKENKPVKNVTFCFLLENTYTFVSALFVFVASLPFVKAEVFQQYKLQVIILIVLFFVFFNPYIIENSINFIFRLFKKEPVKLAFRYRELIFTLLLFVSDWIIMCVGFYLLLIAIYPAGHSDFFYLMAVFSLANVIGILSFFTPLGIGVREAVLILALKLIMPAPYAVIITIVSRLWTTAGDLLNVLSVFIYEKAKIKKLKSLGGRKSKSLKA